MNPLDNLFSMTALVLQIYLCWLMIVYVVRDGNGDQGVKDAKEMLE